ncbi:MAG: hypothetical protein IPK26_30270 [Planctomycetes bacterium]|nr:hypothetical protein [Planctomycetota bacterium]
MLSKSLLLLAAASACSLCAQSNAVAGTDVNLYDVSASTIYGRRGAAYPNGEVGIGFGHAFCNGGTVHVPWASSPTTSGQMTDVHFKIAFLLVRESNGRMVQISTPDSYVKHSRVTYNLGSSNCGTCQSGPGSTFRIGCYDAYSTGFNGDQFNLGPPNEIDPWLGSWNPVGSYFDRGDPVVGGAAANDGTQSLTYTQTGNFDAVKNRVTVPESELSQTGTFYGQVHLVCEGEPVANRGNNQLSERLNFSWSGSSWSTSNAGGPVSGSVLNRWTGAQVNLGGNGANDGRFAVGVVVTPLGGGMYHYEYAVHNIDNSRGGATFRVPVQAGSTTTNFGVRDNDTNALNQWTAARVGNEVVFSAAANNPLNWNSIFNFWFDCNVPPGGGTAQIDQARVGPGALTVAVTTRTPSGVPAATIASVGNGCGGSPCDQAFYETFGNGGFDLGNSGITMTKAGTSYAVGNGTGTYVPPSGSATNLNLGDDQATQITLPFALPTLSGSTNTLWVCSNGFVSTTNNGTSYTPSSSALLSGAYCWYGLWKDLNPSAGGAVRVDSSATVVRITWDAVFTFGTSNPNTFQLQFFPNGDVHVIWQTVNGASAQIVGFSPGAVGTDPGIRDISATRGAGWSVCLNSTANLALAASAPPVLGTTVQFTTSNIPAGSPFGAVLINFGQEVPARDLTSIGMAGCVAHVISTGAASFLFFPAGTTAQVGFPVTANTAFLGVPLTAQSFTYSPPRTVLGAIASNGLAMVLGM